MDSVELQDDGMIIFEDKEVGSLSWNENIIVNINIDEEFQKQGIATAVIGEFIKQVNDSKYEKIKTTTVISGAMETVLQKNGFEAEIVEEQIFEDSDLVEEKVEWFYYF